MLADYIQPAMCGDCPFSDSAAGTHLRESLAPGRMASIQEGLLNGAVFQCHKTTMDSWGEAGDEEEDFGERPFIPGPGVKLCAGAMKFMAENNSVPQELQLIERLNAAKEGRVARW